MSELQTEKATETIQAVEGAEAGTDLIGADQATATGDNQDNQQNNDAANQEAVNKAIGKQHAKYREEERKRIQVQHDLDEANRKLGEYQSKEQVVNVPAMPDQYDDNFDALMVTRDAAIAKKAQSDGQAVYVQQQKQAAEQTAQQTERDRLGVMLSDYNGNATKLGLDMASVEQAGNVVGASVSQDVAQFLLGDTEGPLITTYLAANPLELDEVRHMSPMQAAVALSGKIREKAQALKPRSSSAPDPSEQLRGNGAQKKEHPALNGVIFE